mmetsp:Transcript_3001/g.4754  ORF Transcript_3001/g.4754 Transcript_3001/m.4754 type:complete len:222 (+) Transcript_3001:491-1156(+)
MVLQTHTTFSVHIQGKFTENSHGRNTIFVKNHITTSETDCLFITEKIALAFGLESSGSGTDPFKACQRLFHKKTFPSSDFRQHFGRYRRYAHGNGFVRFRSNLLPNPQSKHSSNLIPMKDGPFPSRSVFLGYGKSIGIRVVGYNNITVVICCEFLCQVQRTLFFWIRKRDCRESGICLFLFWNCQKGWKIKRFKHLFGEGKSNTMHRSVCKRGRLDAVRAI